MPDVDLDPLATYWPRLDAIGDDQAKALMEFGAHALSIDGERAKAVDLKANWTITTGLAVLAVGVTGVGWLHTNHHSPCAVGVAVLSLGLVVFAVFLALIGMWVAGEWSMPGPSGIVNESIDQEEPATILRKRIAVLYFDSYERNRRVTDDRATYVEYGQLVLMFAVILGAITALVAVLSL